MQSIVKNGRNNSRKNLSVIANATYTYDNRYSINAVFNHSGSAYLPDGDKFDSYPAISAAWILSNEAFMKISLLSTSSRSALLTDYPVGTVACHMNYGAKVMVAVVQVITLGLTQPELAAIAKEPFR